MFLANHFNSREILRTPRIVPARTKLEPVIKELTASSYKGRQEHLDELAGGEVRDLDKAQMELYNLGGQFKHWKARTVALNRVQARERAAVGYVPWFLRCNPSRFPYWFGNPDPRNKLLLQALHRLQELPVATPKPAEAPPPGPTPPISADSAVEMRPVERRYIVVDGQPFGPPLD